MEWKLKKSVIQLEYSKKKNTERERDVERKRRVLPKIEVANNKVLNVLNRIAMFGGKVWGLEYGDQEHQVRFFFFAPGEGRSLVFPSFCGSDSARKAQ